MLHRFVLGMEDKTNERELASLLLDICKTGEVPRLDELLPPDVLLNFDKLEAIICGEYPSSCCKVLFFVATAHCIAPNHDVVD